MLRCMHDTLTNLCRINTHICNTTNVASHRLITNNSCFHDLDEFAKKIHFVRQDCFLRCKGTQKYSWTYYCLEHTVVPCQSGVGRTDESDKRFPVETFYRQSNSNIGFHVHITLNSIFAASICRAVFVFNWSLSLNAASKQVDLSCLTSKASTITFGLPLQTMSFAIRILPGHPAPSGYQKTTLPLSIPNHLPSTGKSIKRMIPARRETTLPKRLKIDPLKVSSRAQRTSPLSCRAQSRHLAHPKNPSRHATPYKTTPSLTTAFLSNTLKFRISNPASHIILIAHPLCHLERSEAQSKDMAPEYNSRHISQPFPRNPIHSLYRLPQQKNPKKIKNIFLP